MTLPAVLAGVEGDRIPQRLSLLLLLTAAVPLTALWSALSFNIPAIT